MRLSESDVAMVYDLIKDYQWHFEHACEIYGFYGVFSFMPYIEKKFGQSYREVRQRIGEATPLLIKVLSGNLPAGFTLLRTIDEQCLAWNGNDQLGMHGPSNEFQARLWCWQHESFNDDITHSLWLKDIAQKRKEERVGLEVDEAVGDYSALLGSIGETSAVLDEPMIERMFNQEMYGDWK